MKKLFFLLLSIALASCNNANKTISEIITPTEEISETPLTELIEPVATNQGPTKTVYLSKKIIGPFTCQYQGIVQLNQIKDTTFYVYIGFNNFKYDNLTDIHSFMYLIEDKKSEKLQEFCKALSSAKTTLGQDVRWLEKNDCLVQTYDFRKDISLSDIEGGYNYMTSSQVDKFINWVNSIGINK
jgi:hypothetical protein